jgi:hemoglobin-like flavoprotein
MTPTEIALVRQSFERLVPVRQSLGLAFYDRLFAADPSLRALFRGDIGTQAGHLMAALQMVVRSLDDLGPVLGRIEELGRRHAGYGAEPRHFATVGGVFLVTLREALGAAFTPEVEAAWASAYGTLAGAMMAAMAEAMPRAA